MTTADDTFVIVKKDLVGKLLAHLNTQHERIEFTLEGGKDQTGRGSHEDRGVQKSDAYRQVPSPRVTSQCTEEGISPTNTIHTGISIHNNNGGRGARDRKYKAGTGEKQLPMGMVRRIHRRVKNKERLRMGEGDGSRQASRESEVDTRFYISIPYIHRVSEQVTHVLRPYAKVSTRPEANLIARLVKSKDRLGVKEKAGLVYRYNCH